MVVVHDQRPVATPRPPFQVEEGREPGPGEPYGLVKKVTVPVPRLPVLFCTAVMAAW
jgi:hypothetical protein